MASALKGLGRGIGGCSKGACDGIKGLAGTNTEIYSDGIGPAHYNVLPFNEGAVAVRGRDT